MWTKQFQCSDNDFMHNYGFMPHNILLPSSCKRSYDVAQQAMEGVEV